MLLRLLNVPFIVVGSCSLAMALGTVKVENAKVGQRTLVLTFDDSIQPPDLSKIRVQGYDIENAVFVEEMGPTPTRFAPHYLDMTLPGSGNVVEFSAASGMMVIERPQGGVPVVGGFIADTAFGGLLRKITAIDGLPQPGITGKRWTLTTVDAEFAEAVFDCDIAFKTRIDMNQALADFRHSTEVAGTDPDSTPAFAQMGIALTGAQVLFQPVVTGRIKVRNGKVEIFQFQANGDYEVMGNMKATLKGAGDFQFTEELPGKASLVVPIGSGLFLRMRSRPAIVAEFQSQSQSESLSAHAEFRIRNSMQGELGYSEGRWRPMAENKMTWSHKPLLDLQGHGQIKLGLKPRVEMLLAGNHGPVFSFDSYARFVSSPRQTANLAGMPVSFGSNKELSLGTNIFMESRTNFTGTADSHNFLLFTREQSVLSPPREGTLSLSVSLKEADSNRIALHCQTYPKSDYYIVQSKLGSDPWETILEKATTPKIRMAMLKPNSQYRFRAFGVNAMGMGPAFPPEGVAFTSPSANRPPFLPLVHFPDSGSVLIDSVPKIVWKGGDPDAGAKVLYSVYLDSRFPPLTLRAGGLSDTTLILSDLKPGITYFWKVVATDGINRSEGPVSSFTTKSLDVVILTPEKRVAGPYPMVFVPKGTFLREDGRTVQVGPLYLGKFEVTQSEYAKLKGRNPSYRIQDSLPVDKVTWEEAEAYCSETGGRLPTEAEWEYAARAGNVSSYYWGEEAPGEYAWYRDNSDNRTQKVGLKKPNTWGLHDMAGNVFEWVQDWYGDYSTADLDDPKGPSSGTAKVIRGASWYSESGSLSLTARYNNRPGFRNFKVGFRCAKDPMRTSLSTAVTPTTLAGKSLEPSKPDVTPSK